VQHQPISVFPPAVRRPPPRQPADSDPSSRSREAPRDAMPWAIVSARWTRRHWSADMVRQGGIPRDYGPSRPWPTCHLVCSWRGSRTDALDANDCRYAVVRAGRAGYAALLLLRGVRPARPGVAATPPGRSGRSGIAPSRGFGPSHPGRWASREALGPSPDCLPRTPAGSSASSSSSRPATSVHRPSATGPGSTPCLLRRPSLLLPIRLVASVRQRRGPLAHPRRTENHRSTQCQN
jgi:hypothetical protein